MSRLARIGLIALLATLLHSAVDVEALCGHCFGSHACVGKSQFQICFDGVPSSAHPGSCPADKPICTDLGAMCISSDFGRPPACGDTSKCGQCGNNAVYACTTLTSFGKCNDGELVNPNRLKCPAGQFCSVRGAAEGTPCVAACDPEAGDSCDRETESGDNGTTPTTTPPTTTPPTTTPPTTTPPASVDANAVCQREQKAGRIAIPDDKVCTSFIHCSFRANAWQGVVTNCPIGKPYFHAKSSCGPTKPTGAGCV